MKRRSFIGLSVTAAAALAAAGYVYVETFDTLARKMIMHDTKTLQISPEEYEKFFSDVEKNGTWNIQFTPSHKQLIKWHYHLDNPLFHLPHASNYKIYRSKMVSLFLLSTDFFQHRMSESRKVKYNALYDPYLFPCSNPFSNLYYPS